MQEDERHPLARSAPTCPLVDTRLPLFFPVSEPRCRVDVKHGDDTRYALFRVRAPLLGGT